ncbi:SDR family oxidoreductase [Sinomonas sp. JGH33]|uniref:SDR family oxidoreductase n=1 Tax=Sinomonas terricola TaxID=3110330 RepID=A0ABU5T1X2_9MICC|nr:SDR family oxidoreductase [Sinomonas sp. JGH33]MEA5453552.1 SDR family oxidoreductase [Sinomonas sp. JGH33]
MNSSPVLMVGGTGFVGGQVVTALRERGKSVRGLVRPASDASRLEAAGVEIARGDMMDLDSLVRAMEGADAVITTAAGYTRHSKGDTAEIDVTGNRNLADAAARTGVRCFVLTSILTCDQTPDVPHFWHKKLMEDRLEQQQVPFVALRPGAFLDQITRFGGDPFAKGRLSWIGSPGTRITFVLTADLAAYLAAAVDADIASGERIDIGWDRPVSMQDVAGISSRLLGRPITVRSAPTGLIRTAGRVLGPVMPMARDMGSMLNWFETGRYVADTTRQAQVFGVPTAEDAIARFITGLGHPLRA